MTGSAADLLRVSVGAGRQATDQLAQKSTLAGHLCQAQTFLRTLGIDITFSRGGRAGSRVIRMRRSRRYRQHRQQRLRAGPNPAQNNSPGVRPSPVCSDNGRLGSRPTLQVPNRAADDADSTDAKASFPFGQLG